MRICHITTFKLQDARIYYRMCYGLAKQGLPAVLVAPETPTEDMIVQCSAWNGRLPRASRSQRIGLALRAALAENADVYHIHEQELIPVAGAQNTAPLAAVVFDAREDYPALMRMKYWLPRALRPLLARTAQAANLIASLGLDGIVAADPDVENDFRRLGAKRTWCITISQRSPIHIGLRGASYDQSRSRIYWWDE